MKRREFYHAVKNEVQAGRVVMNERKQRIQTLEGKVRSGKYTQEYINELEAQIRVLKKEIEDEAHVRQKNVSSLIREMEQTLKEEVSLRGEDITADARLLEYTLKEEEVVTLLERHSSNPTMTQLILKYAKDHGMDLKIQFVGNKSFFDQFDEIFNMVQVALRHYDVDNVYNRLFEAPNKALDTFNTDDRKWKDEPVIEYSDNRLSNAVRMLSGDAELSPIVQEGIIQEFAGHTGALTILKNVAEKAKRSQATSKAAELLGAI